MYLEYPKKKNICWSIKMGNKPNFCQELWEFSCVYHYNLNHNQKLLCLESKKRNYFSGS